MEIEVMKYWSNKLSNYVDIDKYPYRLENIVEAKPTYFVLKDTIYLQYYCLYDDNIRYQIKDSHFITDMRNYNEQNVILNEYMSTLEERREFTLHSIFLKTYLIFDTKSEMIKWKLRL